MKAQWRRLLALFLRDSAIVAVALGLWAASVRTGAPPALQIVTALATVVTGYLAHEWGHLLGAWSAGAGFALPTTPFQTFFLFRFDAARSTRPQFFAMALGGFAASLLTVALFVAILPSGLLASRIALALTAFGVLATLVIEVPEFLSVWRGGPIPNGAAFVKHGDRA